MRGKNISLRRRLARSCSQQTRSPSTRGFRVLGRKPALGLLGRKAAKRALKKLTRFFSDPRLSVFIRGKVVVFSIARSPVDKLFPALV